MHPSACLAPHEAARPQGIPDYYDFSKWQSGRSFADDDRYRSVSLRMRRETAERRSPINDRYTASSGDVPLNCWLIKPVTHPVDLHCGVDLLLT